jgi:hypothetical protein
VELGFENGATDGIPIRVHGRADTVKFGKYFVHSKILSNNGISSNANAQ